MGGDRNEFLAQETVEMDALFQVVLPFFTVLQLLLMVRARLALMMLKR